MSSGAKLVALIEATLRGATPEARDFYQREYSAARELLAAG